ncbi:ribose 5-phosphate isomerase B [Miniphocaeibacter halophilus]|uniref:Ribose 5-phosphate isomerase B n=1 Tax=Miniphocaeibacter halophilus TaxID=2931922 RepID=A0AC61MQU9_9FIRM|nr:ribose 5-phosphate isomerase B [Miniphocaeibacter halophilus]QQK07945.1 ribose 5-phosphate isomerase B [Miniphocaeibacter halophilus]
MKIAIGSDHGGYELKPVLIDYVKELGHEIVDFGVSAGKKANYPVYGIKVAEAVASGEYDAGIVICGTGIGISIAANKVKGIRCACANEVFSAKMAKEHNNANVLALGARVIGEEVAKMAVYEWLNAEFQGGRHSERIQIITDYENK